MEVFVFVFVFGFHSPLLDTIDYHDLDRQSTVHSPQSTVDRTTLGLDRPGQWTLISCCR